MIQYTCSSYNVDTVYLYIYIYIYSQYVDGFNSFLNGNFTFFVYINVCGGAYRGPFLLFCVYWLQVATEPFVFVLSF